ncbi:hypothetical protein FQA47_020420 [Oryzias melastigma]|uniref:Uncharacterized protein n=1 Tax=Oryzias melastigma TaxID=30732 RepID=A0A834FM03_ORYME|nr:hypothetical protein FQA47_020420 [Oryzias melastigma]
MVHFIVSVSTVRLSNCCISRSQISIRTDDADLIIEDSFDQVQTRWTQQPSFVSFVIYKCYSIRVYKINYKKRRQDSVKRQDEEQEVSAAEDDQTLLLSLDEP